MTPKPEQPIDQRTENYAAKLFELAEAKREIERLRQGDAEQTALAIDRELEIERLQRIELLAREAVAGKRGGDAWSDLRNALDRTKPERPFGFPTH